MVLSFGVSSNFLCALLFVLSFAQSTESTCTFQKQLMIDSRGCALTEWDSTPPYNPLFCFGPQNLLWPGSAWIQQFRDVELGIQLVLKVRIEHARHDKVDNLSIPYHLVVKSKNSDIEEWRVDKDIQSYFMLNCHWRRWLCEQSIIFKEWNVMYSQYRFEFEFPLEKLNVDQQSAIGTVYFVVSFENCTVADFQMEDQSTVTTRSNYIWLFGAFAAIGILLTGAAIVICILRKRQQKRFMNNHQEDLIITEEFDF